jgi:hypothetical protein
VQSDQHYARAIYKLLILYGLTDSMQRPQNTEIAGLYPARERGKKHSENIMVLYFYTDTDKTLDRIGSIQ